jgi:Uma2 family endonuclease
LLRFTLLIGGHVETHLLGRVFFAPIDVILGIGDACEVAQPDLIFISAARAGIVKKHGIEGAPDLVIEILSPGTEKRDRGYKRALYARYGLEEYWLVDTDARTVEVWTGAGLLRQRLEQVVLETALLPGLSIVLSGIFRD